MAESITVAVLGGGNGAFATAGILKQKGLTVRLLEAPELAQETIAPVWERGGIELQNAAVAGANDGLVALDLVTDNVADALAGADVVLYVVPAYAERRFTELCTSHFSPDQLVVLFAGNFGGALELASQLARYGVRDMPTIAEMEGLLFNGFKQDQTTVRIAGYKAGLACATLPAGDIDEALARLKPIAADFQPAANVLETGLRNLNPVVHGPVSILNAGRTAPDRDSWRYYWDGVTEPVGKVVEAVDAERRAVTSTFGLTVKPLMDTLLQWYGHQGAKGDTIGEVMSTNPAYEIVTAPHTLNHRFLTEDIPFGLVPLEALGAAVGVAMPVTGALITLASALLGVDYRAEGRNLMRLGLEGLASSQIQHWVETGVRPD